MIIVSVHVHYEGFMPVLRRTGWVNKYLSLHRFRSVYVGGQGRGARQFPGLSNIFHYPDDNFPDDLGSI